MPIEVYVLTIPFCAIPILLVSIDYLNKNAYFEKKKSNVIDFDKFLKTKEKGDAVDSDIAELLDIDKIAA